MPLTGIRILDLSRLLPGPFATMLLTGLGADVIKVEDLDRGDYLRWMPPFDDDDMSAMFTALNRGKRSVRLDLKAERGRELFLDLAARSDVVLESFRPGVMERLGLGIDSLHARNPRLVLCSISGYGADGPDRLRAGHDINYLARTGVFAIGGPAGGRPTMPGVQMADVGGGALGAVVAILAALRLADRTGVGHHCDVSMTDGMLSWMGPHVAAALAGASAQPGAMLLNGAHPCYRVYRCADGWLAVGALEPRFWVQLCTRLGLEELASSAFVTGEEADRVSASLEDAFLTHTRAEWRERFADDDVCVEPVLDVSEMLADPQVRHGATETGGVPAWFPLRIGTHAGAPRGPAPRHGADSRALLAEIGIDDGEFDRLVAQRVTA